MSELRERPLQTIGLLRAAPLPTPIKIYGLSLLPSELVPAPTFFWACFVINTAWSFLWSLTGSSASSLQDALSGSHSRASLFAQFSALAVLFGLLAAGSRYAKEVRATSQLHSFLARPAALMFASPMLLKASPPL